LAEVLALHLDHSAHLDQTGPHTFADPVTERFGAEASFSRG
jgi:hypothetical protein